jgi:hypothetical protein
MFCRDDLWRDLGLMLTLARAAGTFSGCAAWAGCVPPGLNAPHLPRVDGPVRPSPDRGRRRHQRPTNCFAGSAQPSLRSSLPEQREHSGGPRRLSQASAFSSSPARWATASSARDPGQQAVEIAEIMGCRVPPWAVVPPGPPPKSSGHAIGTLSGHATDRFRSKALARSGGRPESWLFPAGISNPNVDAR